MNQVTRFGNDQPHPADHIQRADRARIRRIHGIALSAELALRSIFQNFDDAVGYQVGAARRWNAKSDHISNLDILRRCRAREDDIADFDGWFHALAEYDQKLVIEQYWRQQQENDAQNYGCQGDIQGEFQDISPRVYGGLNIRSQFADELLQRKIV